MLAVLLACRAANGLGEEVALGIEQVIEGMDFDALSGMDIQWPGEAQTLSVKETVIRIAEGAYISPEAAVSALLQAFVSQVQRLGSLAVSVILPVLLLSLMGQMFSPADTLGGMGKHVGFLMVLVPVILCVLGELAHVRETIVGMTERMDRMLPLLLTLLTAVGGSASSAFMHPVVVAASGSMVYLAREVILRLVMCTCAVTAINHLSERAHLSRLAALLKSAVCWLLGVSFTVFLGTMSVQGACSASLDGVAIRAAKYAVDNFVPVVGGMFSDTMDTLIGCTMIVKNALGVTAILVLLGVVGGPMLRTLAVAAVLKLCAALLEPVAGEEVVRAIGDFSGTIVLFLITMLCVGTMYFLLIAQMMLVGNLTVMLR